MPQLESHQPTDAPVNNSPKVDASAAVQKDAGFSHVGDASPNRAWAQMTGAHGASGADRGASAGAAGANGGMDGGTNQGDFINFAAAPDIYAAAKGGGAGGMDGGVGAGSAGAMDSNGGAVGAGAHTSSSSFDNSAASGTGSPGRHSGDSAAGNFSNAGSAGGSDSAGSSSDAYRSNSSDALSPNPSDSTSTSASDAGSDSNSKQNDAALKALDANRQPYDSQTSKLDGNKFQELSDNQYNSLSTSEMGKVNLNNAINLENRFADLGDKAPNFALRGGGDPQTNELAAGQTPSEPSHRHFAVAEGSTSDPATKVSDFAANVNYAQGYKYEPGSQLHAFDKQTPEQEVYKKEKYNYSPAPFMPSRNSGEQQYQATPDDFKHVGSYNFQDLKHDGNVSGTSNTPEHQQAGQNANNLKAMDKILSDYEKQNADYLQSHSAINEQRRAENPPSQQMVSRAGEVERGNNEIHQAEQQAQQQRAAEVANRFAYKAQREAAERAAGGIDQRGNQMQQADVEQQRQSATEDAMRSAQAQMDAEDRAAGEQKAMQSEPAAEPSMWSRLSNSVKSWW